MLTTPSNPGISIVHIHVGHDLQSFGIHKDRICGYSPYFKAAFTPPFEESQTGVMKLPETEASVFHIFYNWVYTLQLWGKDCKQDQCQAWMF